MQKIVVFLLSLFLILSWSNLSPISFASAKVSGKSPAELYPNRLITPAFGIVTNDDLAYSAQIREPSPYDPSKNLTANYWQCVPTRLAKTNFDTWRGEDGTGPSGVEIPMCILSIEVKLAGGLHVYGDRRAHPNSFCQELARNWKKLTRGEAYVCLEGEDPSNESDEVLGKYRSWVWDKFKTHKGCYSYFGDCNVRGCAKGHCPK